MLLIVMSLLFPSLSGQGTHSLKGIVFDENDNPLIGASVFLSPIEKGNNKLVTTKSVNALLTSWNFNGQRVLTSR
jgi:hypothetical protein